MRLGLQYLNLLLMQKNDYKDITTLVSENVNVICYILLLLLFLIIIIIIIGNVTIFVVVIFYYLQFCLTLFLAFYYCF